MSEYIGVSVALDMNRDDFEEAFMHVNLTVRKVLADLPLEEMDCGFGFGARDFEFKVLEGDADEVQKIINDRVREAGLEVVEYNKGDMFETIKLIKEDILLNEVFDRWLRPEWNDDAPDFHAAVPTMKTLLHFLKHNERVVCDLVRAFNNNDETEETEEISAEEKERLDCIRKERNEKIKRLKNDLREWGKVIDEQEKEEA